MNDRIIRAAAIATHRYMNPCVACDNRSKAAKDARQKQFWFSVARVLAPVYGCPSDEEIATRRAIRHMRARLYGETA